MQKEQTSSSPDFDSWFLETHGGTGAPTWELDEDVDEVLSDDYSEQDEE